MITVEAITPAEDILGEGPFWDAASETLWWVDIKRPTLNRLRSGRIDRFTMPEPIGAAAIMRSGAMLVALKTGLARFVPESGLLEPLARPEADRPGNRLNDGKCDPAGRFWVGSMDDAEQDPTGHFYRFDPDGALIRLDTGFVVTNGLGWTGDGRTMFITDSANRTLYRLDYDPESGAAANRRVFARVSEDAGYPDGLTVDAEDHVWSCHWDGGRITRYRPDGSVDRVLDLPVRRPTCCCFGGADGKTLFVTSARIGLDHTILRTQPSAGSVFAVTGLGVSGRSAAIFNG